MPEILAIKQFSLSLSFPIFWSNPLVPLVRLVALQGRGGQNQAQRQPVGFPSTSPRLRLDVQHQPQHPPQCLAIAPRGPLRHRHQRQRQSSGFVATSVSNLHFIGSSSRSTPAPSANALSRLYYDLWSVFHVACKIGLPSLVEVQMPVLNGNCHSMSITFSISVRLFRSLLSGFLPE